MTTGGGDAPWWVQDGDGDPADRTPPRGTPAIAAAEQSPPPPSVAPPPFPGAAGAPPAAPPPAAPPLAAPPLAAPPPSAPPGPSADLDRLPPPSGPALGGPPPTGPVTAGAGPTADVAVSVGADVPARVGAALLLVWVVAQWLVTQLVERGVDAVDFAYAGREDLLRFRIPVVDLVISEWSLVSLVVVAAAVVVVLSLPAWRPVAIAAAVAVSAILVWDYFQSWRFSWPMTVLAGTGCVLLLVGAVRQRPGGPGRAAERAEAMALAARPTHSAAAPEQLGHALVGALAMQGIVVTSVSPGVITGVHTRRGSVNWLVAFLWWLLCIVPMIIYIVNASKDRSEPFTISIAPEGTGSLLTISAREETLLAVRAAVDAVT